jgi:hypothetical protein
MTWLVKLYPPAWRRRYGRELAELVATQPVSYRTVIDLVAGAVDAWLNPQSSTAVTTTDAKGAETMLSTMLQLGSGGHEVTKADSLKAAAVTIGGTLALVAILTWATRLYGKNAYFESLLAMGWLVPFLFSQHYTYLKGRPARVQTVLIAGPAVIVIAIALGNAWINNG